MRMPCAPGSHTCRTLTCFSSAELERESGGVVTEGEAILEGGRGGSCAEAARCMSAAKGDELCTGRCTCSCPCRAYHVYICTRHVW